MDRQRSGRNARKLLWLLVIAVVAAFALVAAGCGGDDEEVCHAPAVARQSARIERARSTSSAVVTSGGMIRTTFA